MAELAIKGHKERGKEVIALLEMLGGKNGPTASCEGIMEDHCYYIGDNQKIVFVESKYCSMLFGREAFTLEEFEALYPYKLRDKVLYKGDVHWIKGMLWTGDEIRYKINYGDGFSLTHLKVTDLKPYIEEDKETSPDKAKAPSLEGRDYSEGRCGYKIPEGFEFDKVENGEIILKSKKKELPKTYEECCEVLGFNHEGDIVYSGQWIYGYEYLGQHLKALRPFSKLLICRDAYWKLADDWKPGWNGYNGDSGLKYCIFQDGSALRLGDTISRGCVLIFPTKEIRSTFFENFKDLICECKELL